jgi:uncharacterized protein YjiS (DUF1127 family)
MRDLERGRSVAHADIPVRSMTMEMHTARSLTDVHGIEVDLRTAAPPDRRRRLGNVVRSLASEVARRRRLRRGLDALRSLDDRMLADIGIARSEAERVVRHGRWGNEPRK